MQLQSRQIVHLVDPLGHEVGQIEIERTEDSLIFGRFVPGPAFSSVQHLFQAFEEAVDVQALSVVEELDAAIAALGLRLYTPSDSGYLETRDVQIWSDGGVTCRVGSATGSAKDGSLENRPPVQTDDASSHLTNRSH
jgi:hypothetical protein